MSHCSKFSVWFLQLILLWQRILSVNGSASEISLISESRCHSNPLHASSESEEVSCSKHSSLMQLRRSHPHSAHLPISQDDPTRSLQQFPMSRDIGLNMSHDKSNSDVFTEAGESSVVSSDDSPSMFRDVDISEVGFREMLGRQHRENMTGEQNQSGDVLAALREAASHQRRLEKLGTLVTWSSTLQTRLDDFAPESSSNMSHQAESKQSESAGATINASQPLNLDAERVNVTDNATFAASRESGLVEDAGVNSSTNESTFGLQFKMREYIQTALAAANDSTLDSEVFAKIVSVSQQAELAKREEEFEQMNTNLSEQMNNNLSSQIATEYLEQGSTNASLNASLNSTDLTKPKENDKGKGKKKGKKLSQKDKERQEELELEFRAQKKADDRSVFARYGLHPVQAFGFFGLVILFTCWFYKIYQEHHAYTW